MVSVVTSSGKQGRKTPEDVEKINKFCNAAEEEEDMDFFDVLARRRSIRRYKATPVEKKSFWPY
ncbi:MAG: hypothetical protein AB1652_08455 [Bacillota bacterium]